jgi:O-antigen/teichoic acid export membrane protein
VEFGKHIATGLWTFGAKAQPALYGLGFILFVVRVLPPEEYGIYVLLQSIFFILMTMGQSLVLQPMTKYAAEKESDPSVLFVSAVIFGVFLLVATIFLFVSQDVIGNALGVREVGVLMFYVPLLFVSSFLRTVGMYFLQAKLQVRRVFFVESIYFLGSLAGIIALSAMGLLKSAETILQINVVAFVLSSLYALMVLPKSPPPDLKLGATTARSLLQFGKYSLGASISYSLYTQADNFILASYLGAFSVGVYNAAKVFIRVFDLMLQVIVFLLVPTVSRLWSEGRDNDLLVLGEKSTFMFTVSAFPIVLLLVIFAPEILLLFYRGRYQEAVPVIQILAVSGLFIPGIGVASSFCYGMGRIKEIFRLTMLTTIVSVTLLILLTHEYGIVGTALGVVTATAVMVTAWYTFLLRHTNVKLRLQNVLLRHRDMSAFLTKTIIQFVTRSRHTR